MSTPSLIKMSEVLLELLLARTDEPTGRYPKFNSYTYIILYLPPPTLR